jgi:hypothetical protein
MTNRRRNDGRFMPDRNAALKGEDWRLRRGFIVGILKGEEWRLRRGFVVGSFRLNAFGGG